MFTVCDNVLDSTLLLKVVANLRSAQRIKLKENLPFGIIYDDLQQSIGLLVKSIAFYVAVLAFKDLVQFIKPFFQPPDWMQRDSRSSASRHQSQRS
jgi:hypothetical protein